VDDSVLDKLVNFFSTVSYAVCSGVFIDSFMHYLNANAAALGVIIAFLSFTAQVFFSFLKHKAIVKSLDIDG
jgi:hypothetical protein